MSKVQKLRGFLLVLTVSLCVLSLVVSTASAAPSVTLRLGIETHPGQARNNSCEYWIDLIHKYSNNDIQIDFFPSAVLGEPNEIMEGLVMGTVDLTVQGTGLVGGTIPAFNVIYLPYRWDSQAHLDRFLATDKFEETMAGPLRERGINLITSWERSPRHLLTRNLVVNQASDVQGLMLRLPAARAPVIVWQALGTSTQTISMTEIYSAMQQGVVDAVESPLEALNGMGAPEVFKQLSFTRHVHDSEMVLIGERARQKLTQEQYDIIVRAAIDTQKWTSERALSDEQDFLKMFIETHGVSVTHPDLESFMLATADVVKNFTEELAPGLDEFIRSLGD